jgi:hypothetical protein
MKDKGREMFLQQKPVIVTFMILEKQKNHLPRLKEKVSKEFHAYSTQLFLRKNILSYHYYNRDINVGSRSRGNFAIGSTSKKKGRSHTSILSQVHGDMEAGLKRIETSHT